VVLDVDTGRVLAAHRLDVAARTLAAPGSAVKPFTLLALLESGKVQAEQPVVCRYEVRVAGRRLDCSHARTPQAMQAATALAYSCNSYFAEMAARLTDDQLVTALTRAGLAAPTGLVEREAAGSIRTPGTPEQRQLLALGVEGVQVTPLGLLAAYRKLALARKQPTAARPALSAVWEGLAGSTSYGMAALAQPAGLAVAGKTGTAGTEAGWTHAWFAGYAPADKPEIAVVVFLEAGRGGADAAPVAREIFTAYAASHSGDRR